METCDNKISFFERVGDKQQQNEDNLVKVGYYGSQGQLVLFACPHLRKVRELGGAKVFSLALSFRLLKLVLRGRRSSKCKTESELVAHEDQSV